MWKMLSASLLSVGVVFGASANEDPINIFTTRAPCFKTVHGLTAYAELTSGIKLIEVEDDSDSYTEGALAMGTNSLSPPRLKILRSTREGFVVGVRYIATRDYEMWCPAFAYRPIREDEKNLPAGIITKPSTEM